MLGVCRVLWLFLVIGITQATTHNAGLNQTIQDLENGTAEQKQEYAELKQEMAELKQEMAEQNQTITDMEKGMACTSLVMTQSIAQNALLNQKIGYFENVIMEVAEQNQTITGMEKEMAEQNQTITGMEKEMAKQKQEISEQKQEMAKLKQEMTQVSGQKQEMAKQKQEMVKQKQEMAKQKQEMAKQKQEMVKQKQEVAKQKQEMAKQKQEMAKLKQKQNTNVMFSAYLDYYTTLSNGKVVAFNRVITNIGNKYNPSTGVFTCPVAGYYVFDVHVMGQWNKKANVDLHLNGRRLVRAYAMTDNKWQTDSAHVNVFLRKGDKVDVRIAEYSYLAGSWRRFNMFSGHLVNPL